MSAMNAMTQNHEAGKKRRRKKKAPSPEPVALKPPAIRPEILEKFGRRAARLIGDAVKGDDITASVIWLRIHSDELWDMQDSGLLIGGFDERGRRDGSRILCNV